MIFIQIYVDDIIFGYTNYNSCKRFAKLMQSNYEMSMMGELSFFLGLQAVSYTHLTLPTNREV